MNQNYSGQNKTHLGGTITCLQIGTNRFNDQTFILLFCFCWVQKIVVKMQLGLLTKSVPTSTLLLCRTEGSDFNAGVLIYKFTIQIQQLQDESESLESHI